jgi:3'-phosphoadenosine 5'-phosphosulfate sulfotransferase (PAPS reductase)/FAD synthetase
MRVIVALSGGKASAYCAGWAFRNYRREDVVLYFNDTKWEHPDLYRFLLDLERHFGVRITEDSDGRDPEQIFDDKHALANNRMPFCSRILKAERLQSYFQEGDVLIFGIGINERHRAERLVAQYQRKAATRRVRSLRLRFPLIEENVTSEMVDQYITDIGVTPPLLYRLGFEHNNCSGGCVRAGKLSWKRLYDRLPEVYLDRERVEEEFMVKFNRRAHFLKDETLREFRGRIVRGELSAHYADDDEDNAHECIGICDFEN